MSNTKIRVGPITMAFGLIVAGVLMLVGNFTDYRWLQDVWKLWPLLLIGLGIEFIIKDTLKKRAKEPVEIKFSWASVIIIGLIIITGFMGQIAYQVLGATNFDLLIKEGIFGNAVQYTRTFEKEPIELIGDQTRFVLVNKRGDIIVKASNDNKVYIEGEIITGGPTEEEAKARAENIDVDVTGDNNIVVKSNMPETNFSSNSTEVNYTISLPKGINVEIENNAGQVFVEDIESQVNISNKIGSVRVVGLQGNLDVKTSVGEINCDRVAGEMELESKNGAINVIEPGGTVVANTTNGEIELNSTKPLMSKYNLTTRNGRVLVELPEDSSLKIDAYTKSGSVQGPGQLRIDRDGPAQRMEGTIGEGKGELKVTSRVGSVEIFTR